VKLFSKIDSRNKQKLTHINNAFVFRDEVLFHVLESIEMNKVMLDAHLYSSQQQRNEQTSHFLKKIFAVEASAKKETFHTKQEALAHLKSAAKFFRVAVQEEHLEITRKTRTLSKHMATMGTTIMLTNHSGLAREKILDLDRQKDYLEKTFDVLKNEFDGKRLRGSSKDAVEGRLFIKFITRLLQRLFLIF